MNGCSFFTHDSNGDCGGGGGDGESSNVTHTPLNLSSTNGVRIKDDAENVNEMVKCSLD